MDKNQLISNVSYKTGIYKYIVATITDSILDEIKGEVVEGNSVKIRNFGTFKWDLREARIGRNPHTGEAVEIPRRILPTFKPAKNFIESVSKIT